VDLHDYLEELLGVKVDLVTAGALQHKPLPHNLGTDQLDAGVVYRLVFPRHVFDSPCLTVYHLYWTKAPAGPGGGIV